MTKKFLSWLLASVILTTAPAAQAQQPTKIPRIGYLTNSPCASAKFQDAFRQGLRDLGYIEGKNIVIDWRSGEQSRERQRVSPPSSCAQGRYHRCGRVRRYPRSQGSYRHYPHCHG